MSEYSFWGMHMPDGGDKAWDFNHDGELDSFERNSRFGPLSRNSAS